MDGFVVCSSAGACTCLFHRCITRSSQESLGRGNLWDRGFGVVAVVCLSCEKHDLVCLSCVCMAVAGESEEEEEGSRSVKLKAKQFDFSDDGEDDDGEGDEGGMDC